MSRPSQKDLSSPRPLLLELLTTEELLTMHATARALLEAHENVHRHLVAQLSSVSLEEYDFLKNENDRDAAALENRRARMTELNEELRKRMPHRR